MARAVDFGNTSRIVTFLCPDRGRLACMVAGAKRPKSRLGALLDTFNRLELVYYWKDSRSVQKLGDATLLDGFAGIKADLNKTLFGSFPLELAYKVAHENEPSQQLYATLVRGLQELAVWESDPQAHGCWQVMQLLKAAGFAPALSGCADCGRPLGKALGFSYRGGVTCSSCRADRRLSSAAYRSLCALADKQEACPAVEDADEVFAILAAYATHQLETSFRSVRVINQVVRD